MTNVQIVLNHDVSVLNNVPASNYDNPALNGVYLQSATTSGYGWKGLWKGSLITIPKGSTISSAKLYIYYFYYPSETYNPKNRTGKILRNTSNFIESTVTWNTKPTTTTTGQVSWTHPTDYGWWYFDLTTFIQDIIDGDYPNYGFTMQFDNEVGGYAQAGYYDHENGTPANRPYFDITYTAPADAWLTGWTHRKSHIITSAFQAGANYQVPITVHYGSGADADDDIYCESQCKTDFGDIRFTDADKTTELDYWIMSKTDSNNAVFWVEVKGDLGADDVKIYVYYGKSDATTGSNFDNTFVFGDPFDSETLNVTRWTSVDGTPVYTIDVVNHRLEVTDMDGTNWETGKGFHSKTFTMPAYWMIDDAYSNANGYLEYFLSTAAGLLEGAHILHHGNWASADLGVAFTGVCDPWDSTDTHSLPKRAGVGGNADYGPTVDILTGTTYWKMYKKLDGKIYIDDSGTNRVSETNTEVPDRFHLGISRDAAYVFGTVQLGAFRIRSYVSPEPAHSTWGYLEIKKTITDLLGGLESKLRIKEIYRTITDKLSGAEGSRNFGNEVAGVSSDVIEDQIIGSVFTSPPTASLANSITVNLVGEFDDWTGKVKCAIYKLLDLSLVGTTEERTVTVDAVTPAWFTFNFITRPALAASMGYILAAWSENLDNFCCMTYIAGDTDQQFYQFISYDGFPDPLDPDGNRARNHSIYCTTSLVARTKELYRTKTDLLGGLDTILRSNKTIHRIKTDILGGLDTVLRTNKTLHRTIIELLGALDTKLRLKEIHRTITELLGGLDVISRIKAYYRTITDILGGLDTILRIKGYKRVFIELLGGLDTKSRIKELHRTISDLLSGLDTVLRTNKTLHRIKTELLGALDTIKRTNKTLHRTITDKLGGLDIKTRIKEIHRTKTDLLGALDTISYEITEGIQHLYKTITEILGGLDTISKVKSIHRTITDLLGGLDTKSRIKSYYRTITDKFGALDTKERVKSIHRTITDKLAGLDTILRTNKTIHRVKTELLGGLDVVSRVKSIHRTITDLLAGLDTKSRIKLYYRSFTDLLGGLDTKSWIKSIHRSYSELLGALDVKSRIKSIHRSYSDLLGVTDVKPKFSLREHDTNHPTYSPDFVFNKDGGASKVRVDSYSTGVSSYGQGYCFIVVDRAWLNGKYLRFNWNGYYSGIGVTWARVRIYDGEYDRSSDIDFPYGSYIAVKGNWQLQYIVGKTDTFVAETVDTLIDVSGGIEEKCTIFFQNADAFNLETTYIDIDWVEINTGAGGIGNLFKEDFKTDVIMEVTGTHGDYGYIQSSLSSRIKGYYRIKTELLGALDIKSRVKSIHRTITNLLGGLDILSRVKAIHRTIVDLLGGLDIKGRVKSIHRIITDKLGGLDTKVRIKEIHRTISDKLGALDSWLRTNKTLHRTITELLGALDVKERVKEIHRTITDLLGELDTKLRTKAIHRTITDKLGALDIISRVKSTHRTITELLGGLDVISRVKSYYRTITDLMGALDIKLRVKSIHRTFTDLLGGLDIKSRVKSIHRIFIDLLSALDTRSKIHELHDTFIEMLGALDTKSRVKSIHRSFIDLLGALDTKLRIKEIHRILTDLLGGLDIKGRIKSIHRSFVDLLGGLDTKSRIKSIHRSFVDLLGGLDIKERTKSIHRTFIDKLGGLDVISRIKSYYRVFIELLGAKDTISRIKSIYRTIIESLGVSDSWSRVKSIFRTIIERLGALDVVRRVKLFFIHKILKGESGRVILEGQDGRFQLEGESGKVKLVGRKEDIIFKGEKGEVILNQP